MKLRIAKKILRRPRMGRRNTIGAAILMQNRAYRRGRFKWFRGSVITQVLASNLRFDLDTERSLPGRTVFRISSNPGKTAPVFTVTVPFTGEIVQWNLEAMPQVSP